MLALLSAKYSSGLTRQLQHLNQEDCLRKFKTNLSTNQLAPAVFPSSALYYSNVAVGLSVKISDT